MIKKMRSTLIENARPILFEVIDYIVGAKVIGLHTDISTIVGERVIVFVLDRDFEKELSWKKTVDLPFLIKYHEIGLKMAQRVVL